MISVSDAARFTLEMVFDTLMEEERSEKRAFEGVPTEELGIRLGVSSSGHIAFRLDRRQKDDEVEVFEGKNVLMVDPEMSRRFDRATLDCVDTPSGPRLTFAR